MELALFGVVFELFRSEVAVEDGEALLLGLDLEWRWLELDELTTWSDLCMCLESLEFNLFADDADCRCMSVEELSMSLRLSNESLGGTKPLELLCSEVAIAVLKLCCIWRC